VPTIQTRDNTGIYYKDWGTGGAVVFSHGRPLGGDAWRRYILCILALCAAISLVAALANAQELAASTSNATGPASGWWSPVRAESATAPQLQISKVELIPFKASDSFRTYRAQRTTYSVTEPIDGQIASLQYIGVGVAKPSLLASRPRFATSRIFPIAPASQVRDMGIKPGGFSIPRRCKWSVCLSAFTNQLCRLASTRHALHIVPPRQRRLVTKEVTSRNNHGHRE
jgi:hypothetical protein